jgi:membrane-associated phospholipid phosphatase
LDGLTRRTDLVILAYLLVVGSLVVVFRDSLDIWRSLGVVHLVAATGVYALAFLPTTLSRTSQFVRNWYPAIAFPIFYKEVELLARAFGNWSLTEPLQQLEMQLFSGHPSLYLSEQLGTIVLSEYLHFCYVSFIWLFPVIGGIWYFSGSRRRFEELMFLVSVTFASSYVFYVLFPVDSPFYLFDPLREPLSSGFFYELVHFFSSRGGARGGAFPSSHVSISTVIVLVTTKYQPKWLYWLLPIYVGLVFATVYCRFHYAVDVLAGWTLAFGVVGLYWLQTKVQKVVDE